MKHIMPDITIGVDEQTGSPITVSQIDLCSGGYLLGMQGVGKTSALIAAAVQQLQIGGSVFVIDPTMDMINAIIARMPEERVNDTYLLDLTNHKWPFDLNVFNAVNKQGLEAYATVLNQSMKAFEKLWSEVGSQVNFSNVLYPLIETILVIPELTLAHARRLLFDDTFRQPFINRLKDRDTIEFWEDYGRLPNRDRADLTRPFLGRLIKLMRDKYVKYIICQKDTPEDNKNIDLREAILKGKNIFVHLPLDSSAYEEASKFIGTFFIMQFYEAIFSFRKDPLHKRPGCMFIVDEFENYAFAGRDFEGIYSKARKYGCKLLLAHQHRTQLADDSMKIIREATTGANVIVCFKTNEKDAQVMGSLFSGLEYEEKELEEAEEEEYSRTPTNLYYNVLDVMGKPENDAVVKEFYWQYIHPLKEVAKMRPEKDKTTVTYDFGDGKVTFDPQEIQQFLNSLNELLYYAEKNEEVDEDDFESLVEEYGELVDLVETKQVSDPELRRRAHEQSKIADQINEEGEREQTEIHKKYGFSPPPKTATENPPPKDMEAWRVPIREAMINYTIDLYNKREKERQAELEKVYQRSIDASEASIKLFHELQNSRITVTETDPELEEFEEALIEVVEALIKEPLADDAKEIERERKKWEQEKVKRERDREKNRYKKLSAADVSDMLPKLENQRAFVKVRGSEIYLMETVNLDTEYPAVHYTVANKRKNHIEKQTKLNYCRGREEVEAQIGAVYQPKEVEPLTNEPSPDEIGRTDNLTDTTWKPYEEL